MKCPYRQIKTTENIYPSRKETKDMVSVTEEFADCYKGKCPLYDKNQKFCYRAKVEEKQVW